MLDILTKGLTLGSNLVWLCSEMYGDDHASRLQNADVQLISTGRELEEDMLNLSKALELLPENLNQRRADSQPELQSRD
jgi:hypothetical protein